MAQDAGGMEKSEKPTPQKRRKARQKGQVAQSREIPSVMILLASLAVFFWGGGWMFGRLLGLVRSVLGGSVVSHIETIPSVNHLTTWCFAQFVHVMLPLMIPVLIVGITANVAQFGFLVKEDFLTPDLKKVFSLSGLKRLVSLKALVELFKSVFKLIFIGTIAYMVVRKELPKIPALIEVDVMGILQYVAWTSAKIIFFISLAMIVLSAADYAYQRWQFEKDLRMTKQEVKEDRKQADGDPKVKARIRRVQMEMAAKRMMEMVPNADVVITNPTHLAVALRFDQDEMDAPVVVAKGADHMAAKIREVAVEHGVPLIENKPLARSLYKVTEIGDPIPADLYKAVAEVLAYVYRLKGHPS